LQQRAAQEGGRGRGVRLEERDIVVVKRNHLLLILVVRSIVSLV
jgi:hypothetical protein